MKKIDPRFAKFAQQKSNAAIKEGYKQEKRQYKKERADFFEQKKKEASEKLTAAPKIAREKMNAEQMPLNKYLAHGGVSSRREAAELIKDGKVKVNGKVVTEPGYKMADGDEVTANGKKVFITKNLVYILMNKPKDYITTTDDPQKRKTVLDIIKNATSERVYPVGRLDRNTSGVLLITNDGELAQKLTHPSNEIKKIYAVTLNKALEKGDFDQILKGVTLEDGPAYVDVLAYSDMKDKTQVGVEIHSGRNRIVRRIFESLGYEVKNLDRVMFAGLTKKNVERGKYRFLTEKEVRNLKYFGKEAKGKRPKVESEKPKTEGFKPKMEGRRPETGAGKRKMDGLKPKAEGQKLKAQGRRTKTESKRPDAGAGKWKMDGLKPKAEGQKLKAQGGRTKTESKRPDAGAGRRKMEGKKQKAEGGKPATNFKRPPRKQ